MKLFLAVVSVLLVSLGFISVALFIGTSINEIVSLGHRPVDDEVIEILTQQLAESLVVLLIGLVGSLIASIILIFNKYRKKWYFWSMLVLSVPFVFVLPVGTIAFFIIWIFLITQRKQFFENGVEINA